MSSIIQRCQACAFDSAFVRRPDFERAHGSDPSGHFELVCDASGIGLGAVLLQDKQPIAYESATMSPAERRYHIGEQELLAVIHALRVWRCYLEGAPFVIVTDHSPNAFFEDKSPESLSPRQIRWAHFHVNY